MMKEIMAASDLTFSPHMGWDDYYEPVNTVGMVQAMIAGDAELAFAHMLAAWKLK